MELINLLNTDYYDDNLTMQELQQILGEMLNHVLLSKEDVINQMFLDTMSTLLSREETILGIVPNTSKSDILRRETIKAKLVGRGITTKQLLLDTIKSYGNGEIEIDEIPNEYKVIVRFVSMLGIPENMESLKQDVERMKPAHLQVVYEFLYNTWAMLMHENATFEEIQSENVMWENMKHHNFDTGRESVW